MSEAELEHFIMERFGMEPKEGWYDPYRYDDRVKMRDFIQAQKAEWQRQVLDDVVVKQIKLAGGANEYTHIVVDKLAELSKELKESE